MPIAADHESVYPYYMVAEDLHDFFLASAGASAAFIGLLFVALTIVLGRLPAGSSLAGRELSLATSSYTALVVIFFISLAGLIPGANLAWLMVALGWLGILSSLRDKLTQRIQAKSGAQNAAITGTLTSIYIALMTFGLYSATFDHEHIKPSIMFTILSILYIAALNRAWSLVGVMPPEPEIARPPHNK